MQPSSGRHCDDGAAAERGYGCRSKVPTSRPGCQRASEPPNKLNTHIHAHAGGHRAGSHARTHTALAQPGNIFRCSFTCTGAASLCDDRDRRGAGGRHRSARQLFHSSLSFLPASASVVSRQQHPHPPGASQPRCHLRNPARHGLCYLVCLSVGCDGRLSLPLFSCLPLLSSPLARSLAPSLPPSLPPTASS